MAALLVFTALALDWLFGEPRRFHPLVGFGRLAQTLERHLHTDSRARGCLAVVLLLTPFTLLALLIDALPWGGVFGVAVLYLAIGWPVPQIPAACWARLPENEDGLEQAAQSYYEAGQVLPVAGSQAAIQALPRLRPRSRVSVLAPGYAEHAAAWRCAGHAVTPVSAQCVEDAVAQADVLILIHPNNPTGALVEITEAAVLVTAALVL